MRINRTALKNNSKTRIASSRPSPLGVGAVFVFVTYIIDLLNTQLSGFGKMGNDLYAEVMAGNLSYVPVWPGVSPAAVLLLAALHIMHVILHAGFTMYCMKLCQDKEAGYTDLLDGFGIAFKILGLRLLTAILVLLWSLLLVVPGIIASYRYRMALYIMIDNPELSLTDCLRRSKEIMDGRKAELFVLDLSFLGWYIASSFPLVSIWVTPYTEVTYTGYYLALRDMPRH